MEATKSDTEENVEERRREKRKVRIEKTEKRKGRNVHGG